MKKLVFIVFTLSINMAFSQTSLDIEKAINMALVNSSLYEKASAELSYSEENTILFRKTFLPTIYTSSVFPSISKSVTRVTTPEGLDIFVNQNQAYYDLRLNIEQKEPVFGGTFAVSSFLNRIDLFGDINNKTYFSTPFSLSYTNNDFSFNAYRYEKLINELRIKEDNIAYDMQLEDIVNKTVNKYFDAYIVNKNIEDKLKALKEIKDIYDVAKKRFNIGSINKGDLLSLELNILDTEFSLNELTFQQKSSKEALSNFVKNISDSILFIKPKEEILNMKVSYDFALDKMIGNNKLMLELERKKTEKELEIKTHQSDNRLSVGINASYGLSNTAPTFTESTRDLQDQQSYSLSLRYLLFDFGKNKQRIKLMNLEKDLLDSEYKIEIEGLKEELFSLINTFSSNQKRLFSLKKKLEVSSERYTFLKNRFSFGKVTITELNIAQREYRQIDNDYLTTLKEVWVNYYDIRKLTMYDYEKNKVIDYN